MFKNALLSVSNKEGLPTFAEQLAKMGCRVVSTGGTAKVLSQSGVQVTKISEQTGFPEVMDGRVKTLHPHVHMALLARQGNADDGATLEKYQVAPFDLVVVNLYAFEKALSDGLKDQQLAEFIDIGGPSMIRAAAKNWERITVVCDPADYQWILEKKELTLGDRKKLAAKAFAHTAAYDSMIAQTLDAFALIDTAPEFAQGGFQEQPLRYGENPQQQAAWYRRAGATGGIHQAQIRHGKPLSYNNLLDLQAAVETLREFRSEPFSCVSVKHNNPCGAAISSRSALDAVKKSLQGDPVSVFGGIVACAQTVTADMAEPLSQIFLECVVAPQFDEDAFELLAKKKNIRLLQWPELMQEPQQSLVAARSVDGGLIVQDQDTVAEKWDPNWEVIGETPDEDLKREILFTWKVCAHLKSNAIAIASQGQTVGLGMGQVNRVDAVKQAIGRMQEFHRGCERPILASDAFFPFADSIEAIAQTDVRWVIQPGGSVKDEEVKAKARELGVNLVLTGKRHFLH